MKTLSRLSSSFSTLVRRSLGEGGSPRLQNFPNTRQSAVAHRHSGITRMKTTTTPWSSKTAAVLLSVIGLTLFSSSSFAQLTGTRNIPGDYADLAAAITDLNTVGVGAGGVTLNVLAGNPQTAPAGGYVIGNTGSLVLTTTSVANQVTIQGNGNTITAPATHTVGNLNDAIFKLIGADWITIQGCTMLENAANVITVAATNTMTEWGVALLYVTATDGCFEQHDPDQYDRPGPHLPEHLRHL